MLRWFLPPRALRGRGAVKRALVVINPISGVRAYPGGVAEVELAGRVLRQAGYDTRVTVTLGPGHATEVAGEAATTGTDLVVAWGGDGTMNEVARALAFGPVALAIVPAGSGNGLARDLGVPLEAEAALALAGTGRRRRIDAGEVNGQLFFNVAGVGLDARVAGAFAERKGRRGLSRYVQVGARELLRYQAHVIRPRVGRRQRRRAGSCSWPWPTRGSTAATAASRRRRGSTTDASTSW